MVDYISLGHRCHINRVVEYHSLRKTAYPFDNIISSWKGIIDCFKNNFNNFFPKKIIREKIFVGFNKKKYYDADKNGYKYLFRGKYFAFSHHNLLNKKVVNKFKERIKRLDNYLQNTNKKIVFLRTILYKNEIKKYHEFKKIINKKYPNLNFKLIFISDNKKLPEKIWKQDDFIIVNSIKITEDENAKTNSMRYFFLFNYLKNNNIFEDFDNLSELSPNIIIKNDSYKGWVIKEGIYHYSLKTQ